MKKLALIISAVMLMISGAMAQTEIPKLKLDQIADRQNVTWNIEGEAVYEVAGLKAIYDTLGYLDYYTYQHGCGCEIAYDGYGYIDEIMSIVGTCSRQHPAPVKHEYVHRQPSANVLDMLKDLTGKTYSLDDLTTPAEHGQMTSSDDQCTYSLADMGYDAVEMYRTRNSTVRFQAIKNDQNWVVTFPDATKKEEVGFVIRKGDVVTGYDSDGSCETVSLGLHFEYWPDDQVFSLHDTYRYGVSAKYNADGHMTSYFYEPKFMSEDGIWRYSRAEYDTKNRLLSLVFDDQERDRWTYNGTGWYYCDYDDETDTELSVIPPAEILAAIPKPLQKAIYLSQPVTDKAVNLEKGVSYVVVHEELQEKLEREQIGVQFAVYPAEEKRIRYEVDWTKNAAAKVLDGNEVELVLAWPHGLNEKWAKEQEFVVEHEISPGEVELFSTKDGRLQVTELGLRFRVRSFSPFAVNWGTDQEIQQIVNRYQTGMGELPQTGDHSGLMLWIALLAASLYVGWTVRKSCV